MMDATDARGGGDSTDARGSGDSAGYHAQWKAPTAVLKQEEYDSPFYSMNNKKRGMAVIFNNWQFDKPLGFRDRPNPSEECNKITELLQTMGFEVQVCPNYSVKMMNNIMKDVSDKDHRDNDCFVCVILSYGEEGMFYGTDTSISLDDFINPIKGDNCPSLGLKPKLFFVQASKDVEPVMEASDGAEAEDEVVHRRRIPAEADVFVTCSVLPVDKGSWFIDAICSEFTKTSPDSRPAWKRLDLLTLMTRVNRRLSVDLESKAPAYFHQNKQRLPCVTSLLTKELQFS